MCSSRQIRAAREFAAEHGVSTALSPLVRGTLLSCAAAFVLGVALLYFVLPPRSPWGPLVLFLIIASAVVAPFPVRRALLSLRQHPEARTRGNVATVIAGSTPLLFWAVWIVGLWRAFNA